MKETKKRVAASKKALLAVWILACIAVVAAVVAVLFQQLYQKDVVLSDDLVVYESGSSSFDILSIDSDSITVSSMEGISEGKVLNSGITDVTPYGMLRRLGASEPVDGGFRIQTEQAALTDAVERCDISFEAAPDVDGGIVLEEDGEKTSFGFVDQAHAASLDTDFINDDLGPLSIESSNTVEGNLKIDEFKVESMRLVDHLTASVQLSSLDFDLNDLELDIAGNASGGKVPRIEDGSLVLAEITRPIPVQVGAMHLVFECTIRVEYSLEAFCNGVSLDAGASLDRSFGFEYTDQNGTRVVNEDSSVAPHFSFGNANRRISMGVNTALNAKLNCLLYGLAGPEASVGLNGEADGILFAQGEGEDAIHLPGIDADLSGRISAKVYVPITGRILVKADNLFGFISGELLNVELFNTGDLITLASYDKAFGTVWKEEKVQLSENLRDFAFCVPEGWSVSQSDSLSPFSNSTADKVRMYNLTSLDGKQIMLSYVYGDLSYSLTSHIVTVEEYLEVVPADFIPLPQNGNRYDFYDGFVVAENHVLQTEDYSGASAGLEDVAVRNYTEEESAQSSGLRLVPKSWVGTRESIGHYFVDAFPYGGSNGASSNGLESVAQMDDPDGGIAFCYIGNASELSEEDYLTVVDILASLHVV